MEVYASYNYQTGATSWPALGAHITEVASIDESEPYEVDQTKILYAEDTDTFWLATASGCSCWEGEWQAERFDNLDQLIQSLRQDYRQYNPSYNGVDDLTSQVNQWLRTR